MPWATQGRGGRAGGQMGWGCGIILSNMAKKLPDKSSIVRLQELTRQSSIFASIQALPAAVHFDGQDKGEKVILLLRARPVTLIWPILQTVFLLGIFAALLLPIQGVASTMQGFNFSAFSIVLVVLLISLGVSNIFGHFARWYFNVFLVTNERLVDLDFPSLNIARWSATPLDRIEDVSHTPGGFAAVLFDYGDVFVQTAGEKNEFELAAIPRPRIVQDILLDLIETTRKRS